MAQTTASMIQLGALADRPSAGSLYYVTDAGQQRLTYWNGAAWVDVAPGLNTGAIVTSYMPALTGDVTTSAGGVATTIANNAVTNAKAASMATKTYKGRTSAGTGNAEDVAVATLKTDLGLVRADVGLGNVDNTSDVSKPVSTAQQTALDLKANLAGPTFTGTPAAPTAAVDTNTTQLATTAYVIGQTYAKLASPTLTGTPSIAAATGTSLAVTGAVTSSGTAGIGYVVGAGGVVTQITSKSTGITLNKITGAITMNNAALAANTSVSFTVTNSTVAATDVPQVAIKSGATAGSYFVTIGAVAAGSFVVHVRNISAGSLSEAIVINFAVLKGAVS